MQLLRCGSIQHCSLRGRRTHPTGKHGSSNSFPYRAGNALPVSPSNLQYAWLRNPLRRDRLTIEPSPWYRAALLANASVARSPLVASRLLRNVLSCLVAVAGRYTQWLEVVFPVLAAVDERNDMIAGPFAGDELPSAFRAPAMVLLEYPELDARRDWRVIVVADPLRDCPHALLSARRGSADGQKNRIFRVG